MTCRIGATYMMVDQDTFNSMKKFNSDEFNEELDANEGEFGGQINNIIFMHYVMCYIFY